MKIIAVDNFDRDSVSDTLICEKCTDTFAQRIASLLNNNEDGDNNAFYVAVQDDHKLHIFEP